MTPKSITLTIAAAPLSEDNRIEYPEDIQECRCYQVDVDRDDSRDCPAHGPNSEPARRQRQQEADDEWAFWNRKVAPDLVLMTDEDCPF